MSEIPHKGCKELLFHRMLKAVISSIIVQFIFMSSIILITNLSPLKPLSWLEDTLSITTSFKTWCYFLILATVIVLQGVICSKNYLNASQLVETRFSLFCSLFAPQNLTLCALYLTIGIIQVWLHLSLENGDYSSLKKTCRTTMGNCLVEEYTFLLIGGLFTGIYYFAKTNFYHLNHLQFPIIPRTKFTQIRCGILELLPKALTNSIWPTVYYICIYLLFGSYLRGIVTSVFFLNTEDEPLDKFSRLLNIKLIFHYWIYATLFTLTMNTMHLLFQAHLTELMNFGVGQSVYNNRDEVISLQDALAMDKVPIIQHLGYLDLMTLSQKEKQRRALIFSLSQPGGHPYNWNCVVEKCLGLIKEFSKRIETICSVKQEMISAPMKITGNMDKPYTYHMRNLAADVPNVSADESSPETSGNRQIIVDFFKTKKQNLVNYLLSKPLIFYFFGVQNDTKIQHLLVTGQPVIWAADAVSSLAVVSLNEDSYGIVQKDLCGIIENLLKLKQALDKLNKMNLLTRKAHQDDREIRIMLTSLRNAVKRSIYRIVTSYKNYMEDLALEQQVRDQLQPFFTCRE